MLAAQNGHVDCLRELVVSGAEVNIQSNDGRTALMCAAENGHVDCLHELVVSGAEVNIQDNEGWTALLFAAQNGHVECLRELVVSGAEVNIQIAYRISALKGHVECLKTLNDAGSEINKESELMIRMIKTGKFDCVQEMIRAGFNVNTGTAGHTALMAAVKFPSAIIVDLLLRNGADVNAKNLDDETALASGCRSWPCRTSV